MVTPILICRSAMPKFAAVAFNVKETVLGPPKHVVKSVHRQLNVHVTWSAVVAVQLGE